MPDMAAIAVDAYQQLQAVSTPVIDLAPEADPMEDAEGRRRWEDELRERDATRAERSNYSYRKAAILLRKAEKQAVTLEDQLKVAEAWRNLSFT